MICMSGLQRMMFRVALCTLLLLAQHAAIAHYAAHARDHAPFQSKHTGDGGNFHSDLCAFHADFDALLSAIESTPPALHLPAPIFEPLPAVTPPYRTADPVVPASRGPPEVH